MEASGGAYDLFTLQRCEFAAVGAEVGAAAGLFAGAFCTIL